MTIRIPKKNILDKTLALFCKERKPLPSGNADEIYKKHGSYVNLKGKREGFWKTLLGLKDND